MSQQYIVDFTPTDGLTPQQIDKLNYNFHLLAQGATGQTSKGIDINQNSMNASFWAEQAQKSAQEAMQYAEDGVQALQTIHAAEDAAHKSLQEISVTAVEAGENASIAKDQADIALEQSGIATAYTKGASYALSDIENVLGALNWITQHGNFVKATDPSPVAGRVYYLPSQSSASGYMVVTDPSQEDMYSYVLTSDTAIDPTKTYYVLVDEEYVVVENPVVEDIGTYYEYVCNYYVLDIEESVQNYIANHLALTADGLILTSDSSQYRIVISTGTQGSSYTPGVHIVKADGVEVGSFGENTIIGDQSGAHIVIGSTNEYVKATGQSIDSSKTYYTRSGSGTGADPYVYTVVQNPVIADIGDYYELKNFPRIGLWQNGSVEVAYITNNELYIERTVVISAMKIGKWQWTAKSSGNLTLQWLGD